LYSLALDDSATSEFYVPTFRNTHGCSVFLGRVNRKNSHSGDHPKEKIQRSQQGKFWYQE